jgi:hypothetical protein
MICFPRPAHRSVPAPQPDWGSLNSAFAEAGWLRNGARRAAGYSRLQRVTAIVTAIYQRTQRLAAKVTGYSLQRLLTHVRARARARHCNPVTL